MMMIGPVLNSCAIILGGLIGASLARYIPKRLEKGLPATFALSSIAIGITMIIKVHDLTVVVMAFILGTALGELIFLETGIGKAATFIQSKLNRFLPLPRGLSRQDFSLQFTALIVLFAASGLGVIGAMTEGLNGDQGQNKMGKKARLLAVPYSERVVKMKVNFSCRSVLILPS